MKIFKPVTKLTEDQDLEEIYFDLSLVINKDNHIRVVDNSQEDYHDFLDCNTLQVTKVKIPIL